MSESADLVRTVHELTSELAKIPHLHDLYRAAVAGLVGTLGFDRAALFLYNPETREMTGTWGTDEQGQTVDESHFRSYVGADKDFLASALERPDRLQVWEDRDLILWNKVVARGWNAMVILQDGDWVLGWLSIDNALRGEPLTDLQREVLRLYGRTLSSLMLRRQFEALSEKYRSQNELKDRLFTILAHDLRGPIGNIGVLLGLACDTALEPSDLREVLVESRQAAQRTYSLLDNVLGWVRGQIEEVAVLRERIPLARPLISVQVWLNASAHAKNIALTVDCPETLTVLGDERMLETIVRNLVSNAIKYSPPGSTVELRGRVQSALMVVEVVDHGVGIPPEKVSTLFAGNQQNSRPGTKGEIGSGLGLMFSSDLARALGGRLEAQSTPGAGSTFRLLLPDEVDGEL